MKRFLIMLSLVLVACGAAFTKAETAEIEDTAATIAKCQALGRACKADSGADASLWPCWDVYNGCMRDAGLHE